MEYGNLIPRVYWYKVDKIRERKFWFHMLFRNLQLKNKRMGKDV